jgi:adenosine/AMP kinase
MTNKGDSMDLKVVPLINPDNLNLILGQSHFIKTVEDVHEALVTSVPGIKFGMAFCEASGSALVRFTGTDEDLTELARQNALTLASGHCFIIFLKDCFPINVLPSLKQVPEIVNIFCATANPVEVIITETKLGRAILGVVDGSKSKGIEDADDIKERQDFLRKIGYKK